MTTLTAPLRHGTPQRHPPCTRCSGLVTADSQGGSVCIPPARTGFRSSPGGGATGG